ncbi:type IV secretory system conjugative DNA transfer family protein [Streptomyces sp. FIT100]|uniref:type IV secretory system conjugative DNA transfer family protein n=1 Tax=Streptomyces sp. FIT100 TaxID=2837956 RepID=UPI0021C5A4BE|nr:type IV secretory system conjugative DNA transfer family protein [Streptomyces sp. FIT100]UUN27755.1 type VI secretion protein [Streptomyces sp. FIT100]
MAPRARTEERTGERGIPDGLLVGILGFLLGLTLLVWTATGLAGLFAHGSWPDGVAFTSTPLAMRSLASDPHDLPAAWPSTPPGQLSGYGLFWGLLIGELMVLVVLAIFVLGTLARWRTVRARQRDGGAGTNTSAGTATGVGVGAGAGVPAAAQALRQSTEQDTSATSDATSDAAVPAAAGAVQSTGTSLGPSPAVPSSPVPSSSVPPSAIPPSAIPPTVELPTAERDRTVPAPRTPSGPTIVYGDPPARRPSAVQAIRDADGPALVVTSDPTVWAETKDARAKLGPVLVYDPGHLCDTPARLHWSPTAGCGSADTAAARAAALLAPVRPHSRLDAAIADTAETLLRCWLHAAAVDGRPFKQLHRWAQGTGAHDPVRILRTHPKAASGLAGLLESALTAHPERREVAQELTARTLSALSSVHIRDACTPNRTDSLALESFADEGGTLYVVGEPIEDPRTHPGAMPLLTAVASSVVEHGRRMAARSSAGRLDPPLSLVLDDVAAVAPIPLLPELLATGADQGLPTLVLLRSQEQARARWDVPLTR